MQRNPNSHLPTQQRRNWGYWDGVAARQRGRLPEWDKVGVSRCRHPFDRVYGEGFWMGWYDEPAPKGAT